ncbi:MAG: hypothetical protein LBF16_10530 [Pseudomonadales bacterium]|nr:hypothetical protein [Pseudomonadales bacterium]
MSTLASWLLFSTALLPLIVHAEGAVRLFDCHVTKTCDGAGQCRADDQHIEFRMEPLVLADDGAGRYTLHYDGHTASMQALAEAGPFYWQQENTHHTLLVNAENRLLWHSLSVDAAPQARIRFLDCIIRQ